MTNSEFKKYFSEFIINASDTKKTKTLIKSIKCSGTTVHQYFNEYWTSKQRQSNPLHEISYRACYKAELPRFFISLFSKVGDTIYDPFSGRGTTIIEGALLNRNIISNDINPLSTILSKPRLFVPTHDEVEGRLNKIKFKKGLKSNIDLSMFYHPETESEIVSLKNYLTRKKKNEEEDFVDNWIRMIATNRLTGHSKNFLSVYTLPPNQAVSQARQIKINMQRKQKPEYKDVKFIILKKTRDLTSRLDNKIIQRLKSIGDNAKFLNENAVNTSTIPDNSVQLTVTSPPFLDVVNYASDNWLRCWFNNIDADTIAKKITSTKRLDDWETIMGEVFKELFRITKNGGFVAFEVGEIKKGKIKLDEFVVPLGLDAGFECLGVIVNSQIFTKTANIWGINNNSSGTNTNRIVIFRKH